MAHFAELNEKNIVQRVLVVGNGDIIDENGDEREELGVAYLLNLFPGSGPWVQTSYNHNFRVRYAGPGMKYYEEYDGFGWPRPPEEFPSWVLNTETLDWEPPFPMPEPVEGYYWTWDEETISWQQVEIPSTPAR